VPGHLAWLAGSSEFRGANEKLQECKAGGREFQILEAMSA